MKKRYSEEQIIKIIATVRHRTRQTKGCGSRIATLTMVFKLAREAEKPGKRDEVSRKYGITEQT